MQVARRDRSAKEFGATDVVSDNDWARLTDVVTQLLPFIGYPRTLNGLRMIDEVTLA
jgi:4-carboxymuconolactone decarboxylase